jgi:hemolysin III
LVSMFGISAAYNIWPVCSAKLILRRLDHSAIYLFIAATYTPFVTQAQQSPLVKGLLVLIWSVACAGVVLKLMFPGRFERLSIMLCLALGWSGLIAYDAVFASLPASTLGLIVAGGVVYSVGVAFHLWDSLRFQNAIWHAFVLTAAGFQFFAIFNSVSMAASASG